MTSIPLGIHDIPHLSITPPLRRLPLFGVQAFLSLCRPSALYPHSSHYRMTMLDWNQLYDVLWNLSAAVSSQDISTATLVERMVLASLISGGCVWGRTLATWHCRSPVNCLSLLHGYYPFLPFSCTADLFSTTTTTTRRQSTTIMVLD